MSAVYFTDRDLGNLVPQLLREGGLAVERHRDHFRHDTPDEDWLAEVGGRGWSVLTHNERIRYTPNEVAAVMTHNVGMLILIGAAPHRTLAENVVNSTTRIESFVSRTPRPFIAKVLRPTPSELMRNARAAGRVSLWLTLNQWKGRG